MSVSVILVNFNTKRYTLKCIQSIYEFTKDVDFEIIMVDNCSQDGSVEAVKHAYKDVKIIINKENKGFGAANNIGIRNSQKKYVFLMNTDAELSDNALFKFYNLMERSEFKDTICCGANIVYPDLSKQESFGNYPSLEGVFFGMVGLNRLFKSYYNRKLNTGMPCVSQNIAEVKHVVGVAMFIRRREIVHEVGLFDEDFFLYFEETELCYRMRHKNFKIHLIPEIKIIHHLSKSMSSNIKKHIYFERSRFLYFKKTGSKFSWLVKVISVLSFLRYAITQRNLEYLTSIKKIL